MPLFQPSLLPITYRILTVYYDCHCDTVTEAQVTVANIHKIENVIQ